MVFRNNRLWKIALWDPLRDQLVHQHICSSLQSQELGTHELVPIHSSAVTLHVSAVKHFEIMLKGTIMILAKLWNCSVDVIFQSRVHSSAFAPLGTLLSLHLSSPISANLAGLEPSQREQRIHLTLAYKLSYHSSHQFLYSLFFSSVLSQSLKGKLKFPWMCGQHKGRAWSFLSYWPFVAAPWSLGAVQGSTEIPQRSPYTSCTCFLLLLVLCGLPKTKECSFFAEC